MENIKKYIAEFLGTAVLVLFGCGVAVTTGNLLLTSLAFGLSIIVGAYAISSASGCHVNPAVTLAMYINGKIKTADAIAYVVAQVAGAFAGSGLLYAILSCTKIGTAKLGANGFEALSATGITLSGAILVEIILTFVFVYTILGVTAKIENAKIAGIVIALALTFVHIIGINLTGTSVNPARSLAPAVIQGGEALNQLWVFIIAPFAGAAGAACIYKLLNTPCAAPARKSSTKKTSKK